MANFLQKLGNVTADLLSNSDFIQRSVGMANSYEDIMFIVQALGREPISLLGKDYLYIFDHVRRNYNMGTNVMDYNSNECPKFTFYKERPTVRFANPYDDPKNLLDRWMPDAYFEDTSKDNILYSYAESNDGYTNNKEIGTKYDIDSANPGVNFGGISSFSNVLPTCDMIKKTNDNFNHGKYKTLIARFHTDSMESKSKDDITQTAITQKFGMSHGRNLLRKYSPNKVDNGYDNPYCRVWTYHHQYNQLERAIRPFDLQSAEMLEKGELSGEFETVGFRTIEDKTFGFDGGSKRLDNYGVLNYKNGMVNIAPTAKIKDYFEHKEDKQVSIKKCMFSIENLAWKSENIIHDEYDQMGLSPEQKGPLGGRIMWFPPYDLSFSEDVSVSWNANQFIGRGEKVYTYTDTERRGNLSFTLLIDHPSILDYWTGHKRNGMKNQGRELIPGNGGGVDEINNQENTLLRFFAGCEVLTARPQEFRVRERKPETVPDVEEPVVEDPPETEVHEPKVSEKTIHCVLYYPNNYSGVDDAPTKSNGTVNAIYYLMNGIGAQKFVNDKKDAEDIPTTIDTQVSIQGFDSLGGYEVGRSSFGMYGISATIANLNADYNQIKSTYADLESKDRKAQYLTGPAGVREGQTEGYVAKYGEKSYPLAKIIGSQAMSLKGAQTMSNLTGATHQWYRRRWYYRVDKAYENNQLSRPDSYVDTRDFGLNAKKGYKSVKEDESIAKAFGLDATDKNTTLISFADMFVALEGQKAEELLSGQFEPNNVKIVKELKENQERFKITEIKFEGHASYQGYAASNDTLSKNRALTFKKWMQNNKFPEIDKATSGTKKKSPKNNVDKGDNSDKTVKMWRSASVIIKYNETSIETAATAESSSVESGKTDVNTNAPLNQIDKVSIPNNTMSIKPIPPINISSTLPTSEKWLEVNQKRVNDDLRKLHYKIKGQLDGKNYLDEMSWNFDNEYLQNQTGIIGVQKGVVERYDNEGEFFELLEKNDPFMHNLITDKIRYFDPAFHSISPEGFNARLTFLHQCTRQGSTVGGSDKIPGTAYNLAFGRPPVCVLRLGDFYYTKIVINSISIQYETPQWDLNPEGIGVMPMFAKVSMNFVFLGGSDLAGPISRLQNAVSFNYYANTGVYDNRAEMVQYDPDGSGHEVKFKPFSYPDMIHGYDKYKKPKASVDVGDVRTAEFAGRTTNLNNGVNGETVSYKGTIDDNGVINYAK
jgi:outer membrane protein OmpA-like peptidoglycan-associated protein